jgi:5'-3' exonuclease
MGKCIRRMAYFRTNKVGRIMSKAFIEKPDNLLIVDSQNIAFRWLGYSDWGHKLAGTISSLSVSYNAKQVIVLGDGRSKWRTTCLPSYKANRKEKREAYSEEEKQKWDHFMQEYQKAVEIIKSQYTYLRFADAEADDIAAYICKYKSDLFSHIWLVSTDKDWDLLISPKVSRFSYIKQNEVTLDTWDQYYSVEQEDYISMKVLMGDKGDNVPGVPGMLALITLCCSERRFHFVEYMAWYGLDGDAKKDNIK